MDKWHTLKSFHSHMEFYAYLQGMKNQGFTILEWHLRSFPAYGPVTYSITYRLPEQPEEKSVITYTPKPIKSKPGDIDAVPVDTWFEMRGNVTGCIYKCRKLNNDDNRVLLLSDQKVEVVEIQYLTLLYTFLGVLEPGTISIEIN